MALSLLTVKKVKENFVMMRITYMKNIKIIPGKQKHTGDVNVAMMGARPEFTHHTTVMNQ